MTTVKLTSMTCTWEVTLHPVAVGTARKEELEFAEGLAAWEINHELMQCDTWDEHRTEHGGSITTEVTHPNLNTADLLCKRHAELQHLWRRSGFSVAPPCRWGGATFPGRLAPPHCKVLRDNVYIEAPKELGLDPSQCDSVPVWDT